MWLKKRRGLQICCFAVALVLVTVFAFKMLYGPWIFIRYVRFPIPKSVKNIKADRPKWEISGHKYVMRFKINKDDLKLILDSRPFKEMIDVRYRGSVLSWNLDPHHGEMIPLYTSREEPKWFRPDQWKNPKVYRYRERDTSYRLHLQVLIYNEEVGEAYLIERYTGRW
jgi:hypothetical protein